MVVIARLLLIAWLGQACALAHGADWPQFRGPGSTGISPETGIARAWPASGPRVLWSRPVGEGFSSPAIRDGILYFLDRPDDAQDRLLCLDLETGRELWSFTYPAPGTLPYNGARNVPTVDEQSIYIVGPFGHFTCIDRATHQVRWRHHLVDDFKIASIDLPTPPKNKRERLPRTQRPEWGFVQSPLLIGDLVIVAPQTQEVGLVAFDRRTGQIRWRSGYAGRAWFTYVTPTLVSLGGLEQILVLGHDSDPEKEPSKAPPARITSIDPSTGRILWTTHTPKPFKIPIPSPVRIAEDRLFLTGGLDFGCLGLEVKREQDQWQTRVLFSSRECASYMQTPLLLGGCLIAESTREAGGRNAGLVCVDRDGKVKWQTGPSLTFHWGNGLLVDGLALWMNGRTGELHLLEVSPESFKLLAKARVLDAEDKSAWAPMAFSRGKLMVRDNRTLKCLDLAAR